MTSRSCAARATRPSLGDASAARGAATPARRARDAEGLPGGARSAALRHQPSEADHAGRPARASRPRSTSASARTAEVDTRLMTPEEAVEAGAMALFGEKYGEEVRVVSMGGDERREPTRSELCGGTHVQRTGDIGLFKIVGEGAVAAGVRRIEALTGAAAEDHVRHQDDAAGRGRTVLNVRLRGSAGPAARRSIEGQRSARARAERSPPGAGAGGRRRIRRDGGRRGARHRRREDDRPGARTACRRKELKGWPTISRSKLGSGRGGADRRRRRQGLGRRRRDRRSLHELQRRRPGQGGRAGAGRQGRRRPARYGAGRRPRRGQGARGAEGDRGGTGRCR